MATVAEDVSYTTYGTGYVFAPPTNSASPHGEEIKIEITESPYSQTNKTVAGPHEGII